MKKILSMLLILTVILSCVIAPQSAMAASKTANGDVNDMTIFMVTSQRANAYFYLSSAKGQARVAQHNWYGRYKRDGNENHHGFYMVTVQSGSYYQTFIWAPSATTNKGKVNTSQELKIKMPNKGTYRVIVKPLTPCEAKVYWKVDYIRYWIYPASWKMTIQSGCTFLGTMTANGRLVK